MSGPRVGSSPSGPVLVVPADVAAKVASLVGRWLAALPADGVRRDPVLVKLRAVALQVEALAAAGGGFADETDDGLGVDYVDAIRAAQALGISPQALRKRCGLGQVPGAEFIGRQWVIPAGVLPEPELDNDEGVPGGSENEDRGT